MKKRILLIIITAFLFIPFFNINASVNAMLDSSANIRSDSSKDSELIIKLPKTTLIEVLDDAKIYKSKSGCSNGWYKIKYLDKSNKEYIGYACSDYVQLDDYTGINTTDWDARVTGNNVNIRKTASTKYDPIDNVTLGTNVRILSTSGSWYKIVYYGDKIGYISSQYVQKKSDITLKNEEYSKELTELGFPESYHPYLTYLHNKYPNWVFKAKNTGYLFGYSVGEEEGANYMQTTNDNYRVSNKPSEGSSWFTVNKGVIAFYMDPRNWLTEERIFMFEKLDWDTTLESSYPQMIKSVFGSGKLADDKYTIPMFNAAKTNQISPVHIAARISLEVGVNGSDSTNGTEFTWKGKKYSGYYNFFNIGAYETTIDGVKYGAITRGLAYAAKLIKRDGEKWDNIETAIKEGSSFLANGYVNAGQGTLYYQKFNTNPDAHYDNFTHQYQTNIQAPATEGNKAYNSYKSSNVLGNTFIFEIPVYENMPQSTSLPNSGDKNNNLKSLSIEGTTLIPNFDKDILTYEVYISNTITSINILAQTESEKASVLGAGTIELTEETTIIPLKVTAQTGEEKTYTITIHRVEDITKVEDTLKDIKGSIDGEYITEIKNNTKVNNFISTITQNGALSVLVTDSKGNELKPTDLIKTTSKITITTQTESKTYTLSVKGDTNRDGKVTNIDLLQVQKHIRKTEKLTGARLKSADVTGDGKVQNLDLLKVQKHIQGKEKF